MRDPFSVLGLQPDAGEADIKSAFRRLAKAHHPDGDPNDPDRVARFQEVLNAYESLKDPARRSAFRAAAKGRQAGEHRNGGEPGWTRRNGGFGKAGTQGFQPKDFGTHPPRAKGPNPQPDNPQGSKSPRRPQAAPRPEPETGSAEKAAEHGHDSPHGAPFNDIWSGLRAGAQRALRKGGDDVNYTLEISLSEAARGSKRRVRLPEGERLDVTIPAGIREGQQIRLRGRGEPGTAGGPAGDLLIAIAIAPHELLEVDGNDVYLDLPVTIDEAVLGARIQVPTLDGPVSLTIPAGSDTGSRLRLRGKGLPERSKNGTENGSAGAGANGDQYVTLQVVLPAPDHGGFEKLIKKWAAKNRYEVRGPENGF